MTPVCSGGDKDGVSSVSWFGRAGMLRSTTSEDNVVENVSEASIVGWWTSMTSIDRQTLDDQHGFRQI